MTHMSVPDEHGALQMSTFYTSYQKQHKKGFFDLLKFHMQKIMLSLSRGVKISLTVPCYSRPL